MHCPDVTLRSIRSHLSHVASLSTYNVFYPFYVRFYHCMCIHFSVSTVTCTCVTCYIKYKSIIHIERAQALDDISRSALYAFAVCKAISLYVRLCCHSNETRAPIANPPTNAQLGGIPYHAPDLHPGP